MRYHGSGYSEEGTDHLDVSLRYLNSTDLKLPTVGDVHHDRFVTEFPEVCSR